MRAKTLRWVVPGALGIGVFYVGGQIEVASVNSGAVFDYGRVVPVQAVAVVLLLLAADQLRRGRRRRTHTSHVPSGWQVPAWQGYGCVVLGASCGAIAGATWFVTELKSFTLVLFLLGLGVLIVAIGVAVVRDADANDASPPERFVEKR